MAGTIDITRTRAMLEAVRDIRPIPSFFRDTFFGGAPKYFTTEKVDFDYKKGNNVMAPFVAPLVGGIPMKRDGFTTRTLTPPKIAPERVITAEDLKNREMGEAVYSSKTPAERARTLEAAAYDELDRAISLREEWMVRELLFNGKISIKAEVPMGTALEMQIDYQFTNKEILTGTDLWTSDSAKPIDQMVAWRAEIVKNSGVGPDIILTDSNTALMFLHHANVKNMFDIKDYKMGELAPAIRSTLVTYIGRLPIVGCDLYAYDGTYVDPETGNVTPFVPEKTVLMGSRAAQNKMYYGAITQMDDNGAFQTVALGRVPLVLFDQDASTRTLRLQSRPLPMPENVDGWAVRQVA
ncbi:MAG: major capsid protein [Cloacibacillus sp.]|nr:major capsid protein [Cloacibacillus sp.]